MSHDRGCHCGREIYEYDDCDWPTCSKLTRGQLRTMITEKQYLWVKRDRAPMFVSNLVELYKDRDFDPTEDKIYEIGPEVKLELNIKVTPAKPVTRGSKQTYEIG